MPFLRDFEQHGFTDELYKEDLGEPKYIIPGVIPYGSTLLAGKPKLGKSWLCLDLAITVASLSKHSKFMGKFPCSSSLNGNSDPPMVLYLAYEDNKRRLQYRIRKLESDSKFRWVTQGPRLGEGLEESIDKHFENHPETKLIVVDTLAAIRKLTKKTGNAYQDEYDSLKSIQQIANGYEIGIFVVHHQRKAYSDDPYETVSGTTGLTGVVDNIAVMELVPGTDFANFFMKGRDTLENIEMSLKWDKQHCKWIYSGTIEEHSVSDNKKKILDLLEENEDAMTPKEIAEATGINGPSVRKALQRLKEWCRVEKKGKGYVLYNLEANANIKW